MKLLADEADALIESLTGLIFRARSIDDVSSDIRARTFLNRDYGAYRRANGLISRPTPPSIQSKLSK